MTYDNSSRNRNPFMKASSSKMEFSLNTNDSDKVKEPYGLGSQLHIHTALTDESSTLSSPISQEIDPLTGLPSPLIPEVPSSTIIDSYSSPLCSSRYPKSPKKKTYGSLTSRPSTAIQADSFNGRVMSEFQPAITNLNTSAASQVYRQTSPPKRNFSSPLKSGAENTLERESNRTLEEAVPSSNDLIIEGRDVYNGKHQWKKTKQLGKGNFSTVVLAESTEKDCPSILRKVAVKIVLLPTNKETKNRVESSLSRELELLAIMQHPSIISLLALSTTKEKYHIILPYMPGGDLFDVAAKYRKSMSPSLIRNIFAQIAIGISYLHHNNIVHRDIKLENILVKLDVETLLSITDFSHTQLISITDFGLSRKIDPNDPLLTTRCGSEDYVPPELLIGIPYDGRQSDSWALGVLLYSIMEGRLPFDPPPNKSVRGRQPRVAHRIARIEWSWFTFDDETKNIQWSEEDWADAKSIVENLLVKRENRLTSKQVCDNKWVNDVLNDEFKNFKGLKQLETTAIHY